MRNPVPRLALGSLAALAVLVALLNWNTLVGNGGAAGDRSQPLFIYCAAGLRAPVEEIAARYEREYGVRIEFAFSGSGALISDIRAAGSGDLYIPAAEGYLADARRFDLIRETAPVARMRPVIAVLRGNPKNVRTLADLTRDDVRVSLANPDVAAVSRAARNALAGGDLWDRIWAHKIVSVDTVNRVANDVLTGAADAGIVWNSLGTGYDKLELLDAPEFESEIQQVMVAVLSTTRQPTRALHFLRYAAARDRGLEDWAAHGFAVGRGDRWADRPELQLFAGGLNRPAVQETIAEFSAREGVVVHTNYDGCGVLVGKIKTGAVPDLYFACDTTFMTAVADAFPLSVDVSGTDMVLISAAGNPHEVATLADLAKSGLRVGVCHPQKSALGALTEGLLNKHQLWDAVYANVKDTPATADRLVEHVVFGSLDAAIVYRANTTRQRDKLAIVDIDDPAARAIQPIAVSATSEYAQLTGRLLDQIRSAQSGARFRELGFEWLGDTPPTDTPPE